MTSPFFGVYPESKLSMDMAHSRIHTDTSPIHVHVFISPLPLLEAQPTFACGFNPSQQVSHSDGDGTSEKMKPPRRFRGFIPVIPPCVISTLKLICLLGQYRFWKTTSRYCLLDCLYIYNGI